MHLESYIELNIVNLLIIGSLAYDYIMNFTGRFSDRIMEEKIHSLSLSFLVDTLKKQQGGTAGNIAYSAKLLGLNPIIFSPAGNDFAPYKKFLTKKKISTKYIPEYKDLSMSSYFVVTDTANNQIGSFYVGALKYAANHAISDISEPIDMAIIAPTDPASMMKSVKECISLNIPYMYDPAFQIAVFTKEQLEEGINGAHILIGNDYEISLIENKLEISHEELISRVPILIQTLAEKGSIIETRKESIHIKSATIKNASDPTGAGDAFRAGFLAGYLRKLPLDICGHMGSVAAAYTVELYGTQTHTYTKKEFIKRFEENFHSKLRL